MPATPPGSAGLGGKLQQIDRAHDLGEILAGDVEINRGGLEAAVAHETLDVVQIAAAFQQMGGKAMPEGMNRG